MTPGELQTRMDEAITEIHKLIGDVHQSLAEEARAKHAYRRAKATAYLASSGTVDEIKARVDTACESHRLEAYLGEGKAKGAVEALRSWRDILSALQSQAAMLKEESKYTRTTPEY